MENGKWTMGKSVSESQNPCHKFPISSPPSLITASNRRQIGLIDRPRTRKPTPHWAGNGTAMKTMGTGVMGLGSRGLARSGDGADEPHLS